MTSKTIIPFGEECYTCESIDSKFNKTGLRKEAYPFDYVGHTYIKNILHKLSNDISIKHEDICIQLFGDNYFYVDLIYGFKYWHDTTHKTIEEFTQYELDMFIEKYNRRYTRLKNILTDTNVIFLSVNHFDKIYNKLDEDYKTDILSLSKLLKKQTFYAINYLKFDEIIENIIFINLPVNLTISFEESKLEFKNTLNNFISSLQI